MTTHNPYEADIEAQPAALRAFAASEPPDALASVELRAFDRVILTGMGASHFAAHPTWTALAARGVPAWWLTTSELCEVPELVTTGSLLWATSQSGESGELVSLLETLERARRPKLLVATTNEPSSTLAQRSDVVMLLHCGDEATVSTKSYVTSLAAHAWGLAALLGDDRSAVVDDVLAAADRLARFEPQLSELAAIALEPVAPRIVLVGSRSQVPSALTGALVLKEAAKFPAEGFAGGDFRHGPLELAGPGLSAILFGDGRPNRSVERLGEDLDRSGAFAVTIDPAGPASRSIETGASTKLARLVCSAKFSQRLSIEIARIRGVEPGAFLFGSKVTTTT